MAVNENDYSREHLQGNTKVPRNTLATLRGNVRRNDPDGFSNVPYFTSLSGKTIRVTYTSEVATVVTDNQVDIALASNSMSAIVTAINAIDSANLQASDGGGYLVLTNLNAGKTHRLEVNPFTTSANDAATILGFTVTPFPGSISYVNELASTPAIKGENNPQGTALIGKSEDLSADAFNRSVSAILDLINKNNIDLNTPVIVYKDKPVTFNLQVASGYYYASISDDTIRVPIYDPGTNGGIGAIAPQHRYLEIFEETAGGLLSKSFYSGTSVVNSDWTAPAHADNYVLNVVYGTALTTIAPGAAFGTWGTPDGGTIYHTSVPNKDKHAAITITSIKNNIVYCSGATFQTKKVMPGDPVYLTATIKTPFDHSGWFAVLKVYDEEHLSVRPLGPAELAPAAGNKPRSLNPSAAGTLRVAVGYYIPAGNLLIVQPSPGHVIPNAVVRIATAVPLREALASDLVNQNVAHYDNLLGLLNTHLAKVSGDAHPAVSIKGFDATNTFADSTAMSYLSSNLKVFLNDMIGLLASTSSTGSQGGTKKIGGQALSIGGATPNSVSAGTLYSQLTGLLTHIQTAATAAGTSYAGGGTWADGTTNPATTVEAQLDKVVSDLAGSTGTAKVQGSAVGSDLTSGTLAQQITDLVNNWGKLSRAQTWTALQTLANNIVVGSGMLGSAANARVARVIANYSNTYAVTLLVESNQDTSGGKSIRLYATSSGQLMLTTNASFDGTNWNKDVAGTASMLLELQAGHFQVFYRDTAADTAWSVWSNIADFQPTLSQIFNDLKVTGNITPSSNITYDLGSSTNSFKDAWALRSRFGYGITEDFNKMVQYRSYFNAPTQTNQVDFEYVSGLFGTLTRKGYRYTQDWDTGTATPSGWTTSSTGTGSGTNTLSAGQHRTTVAHDGSGSGTFTLQTANTLKFRLTDGFVCRARLIQTDDFTQSRFGFIDVGGSGNGITFGPATVDGGGSHNYKFLVGSGNTQVGGPGDASFGGSGMRWYTFAVVGTTLWWSVGGLTPDETSSGGSGWATITVPTGLYHFVVMAHGGGGGFGSSIAIDYVEILTGNREP